MTAPATPGGGKIVERSTESRARVYAAIEAYCAKYRDCRLGQVIGNALGHAGRDSDPFYVEDDYLARMIDAARKGDRHA